MGFLGSIGNFLGTAAKAVATGGISVVAPKLIPKPINTVLNTVTKAQFPTSLSALTTTGLAVATRNPSLLTQGAQPMSLNLGGILNSVGQAFGGNQNPYFQGISNVANLASQFVPQTNVAMRPPMPTAPGVAGAMRSVPMIGRKFFEKFPNLATAIQALRNRGANVTRAKLFSLLKRFGPDILITGGILTAAAVSELMVAGPGHRRMNPGNAKALRRSLRRLESFHKLCVRADKFRGGGRRKASSRSGGSPTFVRQG